MSGVRQTPQLYSEASTFSHPELSEAARVLSNRSWAKTTDRSARTAAARAARQQRFYDLVDPDRTLDPPELIDENGTDGAPGGADAGVPTGPIGAGGWVGKQLEYAAEIVKEGQRRNLPKIALVLAVQCAMGESTLDNVGYGDDIHGVTNPDGSLTTSVGLFQQQNSWGSRSDRMTPSKSAGFFYDALVKTNYKSANDASSSSMAIHRVQINADPMHYARFWGDANLVVDACIAAGESASAGGGDGKPPSGPLGQRMKRSIDSMTGRWVDYDGSFGAQCADVGMQYANDLWGVGMVVANGKDYWGALTLVSGHADSSICWGSEMIVHHGQKELLRGVSTAGR